MNIAALREAVMAMEKTPEQALSKLPALLRDTARKGKKTKLQFNHLGIRYQIRDKDGGISFRWLVSNGLTGRQETYYTKDFMSKNGKVLWRFLAAKINRT